jgi:hypothetical protein
LTYRVVQCATGSVGSQSLLTILDHPQMQLVGLRVYSPDKVGQDAGVIVGRSPVGVQATDDLAEIVALDADCVAYNALGDTFDAGLAVDEICTLLRSGKNVVDTAVSPPLVLDPLLYARLAEACAAGNVSYYGAGLNPGFLLDIWATTMSRTMGRVDAVELTELEDMSDYGSEQLTQYMGFGSPPDQPIALVPASGKAEDSASYLHFRPSFTMLERSMGFRLDRFSFASEIAVATARIVMAATVVEPGTISAVRIRLVGWENDTARVTLEAVYKASVDAPTAWPGTEGKSEWRLRLLGDPVVESVLKIGETERGARADMLMTAAHGVNAIPAVVAASAGMKTFLDLPVFGATATPVGAS